ncbi:MAG: J domain-containing protein, partial [Nitrosopumilaceae archaeon]
MKKIIAFLLTLALTGLFHSSFAQVEDSSSNLEYNMSTEEKIMLFGGFAAAVVGIFLFIARDAIFRKKTKYD